MQERKIKMQDKPVSTKTNPQVKPSCKYKLENGSVVLIAPDDIPTDTPIIQDESLDKPK